MEIALLGEPILRQIAEPVEDVASTEIQGLVQQMLETLEKSGGVGLAAPQVFVSKRIMIVASKPTPRYPNAPLMPATVMINPSFVATQNVKVKDWEGCLSITGIRALVPRYLSIRVSYLDLAGSHVEMNLEGFVARVFQHEYDHLNGLVYLDSVEANRDIISEAVFMKQIVNARN
jgi:peptide deformylase